MKRVTNLFGQSLAFLSAMLGAGRICQKQLAPAAETPRDLGVDVENYHPRRRRYSGETSGAFNECIGSKAIRQANPIRNSRRVNGRNITSRKRRRDGSGKFYNEFTLR